MNWVKGIGEVLNRNFEIWVLVLERGNFGNVFIYGGRIIWLESMRERERVGEVVKIVIVIIFLKEFCCGGIEKFVDGVDGEG